LWAARLGAAIEVMFFVEAGMLLMVMPWIPNIWTHNSIVAGHVVLQAVVYSGFFRGVVSGLGLINLGLGIRAAFTYEDPK